MPGRAPGCRAWRRAGARDGEEQRRFSAAAPACGLQSAPADVPVLTLTDNLLVAAAIAALGAVAAGQTPTSAAQDPPLVFKSHVNLVALNVAVQDPRSRYVNDLRASDFAVYEDGVKQDVRFFESSGVPVDLILLLDSSASMTQTLEEVREAARGIVKTLRPEARGAVIAFSGRVAVLQALTGDRAALVKAIQSVEASGSTALYAALYIALKEFGLAARRDGTVRRQAIAVLSDGKDTESQVSFDEVLALARHTGVNIYTVRLQGPRPAPSRFHDDRARDVTEASYEMKLLARETGGLAFFPLPHELDDVYGAIAHELANQYTIGYEPTDDRIDGRFRRVVVQVLNRRELRARTRLGYTAAAVTGAGNGDRRDFPEMGTVPISSEISPVPISAVSLRHLRQPPRPRKRGQERFTTKWGLSPFPPKSLLSPFGRF
jgi:VWFA-related protein